MRRRDLLLAGAAVLLSRSARGDAADTREDTLARWLAGMALPAGAQASTEWLAYAAAEDAGWGYTARRIEAMRDWSRRELEPILPPGRAVVYPFGGPDALHALALFEAAPRLLLIGLEPTTALPDAAHTVRSGYFSELGAAMGDLHHLTFFRTRDLATDMSRVGALPALLATLARMGGRVTSVSQPARGTASIEWRSRDELPRRLEYAQVDLSNAGLARRTDWVATLRGLAPHVTFMKAASYLPGEARFSYVRRLILEQSALLVQDDTGVPFRDLDARWAKRLFGRYVAPTSPFVDRAQVELGVAYAREAPAALPFAIGYHSAPRSSNLLVAARAAG